MSLKEASQIHILTIPSLIDHLDFEKIMHTLREAGLPENVVVTNLDTKPIALNELTILLTRLLDECKRLSSKPRREP
jgi:hypothetical protein